MPGYLEVVELTKRFPDHARDEASLVLNSISFQVKKGAFVAVVGPSGCGKTTLLRILAGLAPSSDGRILLLGDPIISRQQSIGLVFQEHALFPWRTTLQNIEFGMEIAGVSPPERREAALEFIHNFGLLGFEHYYPEALSGGMRQRAAIARTLITNPALVLMDEPFSALDCQTRLVLQHFLQDLWCRRRDTVLLITHNIEEAVYLSDYIIVLSSRPARILDTIHVDIPRPRDRTSREAVSLRKTIMETLQNAPGIWTNA